MFGRLVNDQRICGVENKLLGAICIIDNPHFGRAHWGPDSNGDLVQWGIAEREIEQKREGR